MKILENVNEIFAPRRQKISHSVKPCREYSNDEPRRAVSSHYAELEGTTCYCCFRTALIHLSWGYSD